MIRRLGAFERALVLSDSHIPFNVVSVLRLENPPAPETVQSSLHALQERHPLLRAVIKDGAFERRPDFSMNLNICAAPGKDEWLRIAAQEMNTRLDPEAGLFRCTYLRRTGEADLILTFHHAIMDAASGIALLDELLRLCTDRDPQQQPALEVAPPVEERFPSSHKGLPGGLRLLMYASSQMAAEIRYQWRVHQKRKPAIHIGDKGYPLILTFPEAVVDRLSQRCRAEKITLNSLLNAALLLAVNRLLYAGETRWMRTVSFADLRPYTKPPTPAENLANYISMLPFEIKVSGRSTIWDLAQDLHGRIYHALKRGDKFSASKMSEALMKMVIGMKAMRMGASALNYSGAVPLQPQYGSIKVRGLHAFLSSFDLGPEVSAQARLFNHALWLDLMFLESDMDRSVAEKIAGEVQTILETAAPV